jgi:hypothetical protein
MQNLDDFLTKPVKTRYIPLKRPSISIRSTIQFYEVRLKSQVLDVFSI